MLREDIKNILDSLSNEQIKNCIEYKFTDHELEWTEISNEEYEKMIEKTSVKDDDGIVSKLNKCARKIDYRKDSDGKCYKRTGRRVSYMILSADVLEYLRSRNIEFK